jgi:hypothetical protein
MRKVLNGFLLLIPLLLAAPCLAQDAQGIKPPQKGGGTSGTKRNAGGMYRGVKTDPQTILEARERQVWEAIKKKDMEAFGKFLAEDQLEVSGDKINTKAQTIEELRGLTFSDLVLSDFKVAMIDKDAAMVIYKVTGKVVAGGQTIQVNEMARGLSSGHAD